MKIGSFKYLVCEGFKNIWDNRLMSLASVGVLVSCMALIGSAMLLTFNVDRAMSEIEKENVVMVYFNDKNSVQYDEKYITNSSKSSKTSSVESTPSSQTASEGVGSSVAAPMQSEDTSSATTSSKLSDKIIEVKGEVSEEDYEVHNEQEALDACEDIRGLDNISSVDYFSSDENLDELINRLGKDEAEYILTLKEQGENPLSCGAKVTLKDTSKIDKTIADIERIPAVFTVKSQRDVAKKFNMLKNAIYTAGYIIIAVLMLIALVIVCNTIRVTMFNRKLEISIMKAVGATNSFIRLPFVVEGVAIGVISAAVTLGLLYVGYAAVIKAMAGSFNPVPFMDHIMGFITIFGAVGVLSGFLGSMFMINKYLRKEGSEFSAMS